MSLRPFTGDVAAAIASIYVAPVEDTGYKGPKRYIRVKKSKTSDQGKEYRLEPKQSDAALTQKITDPLTRKLIGYVFQPDGKGAGYSWRLPWMKHMSKKRYRYAREAVAAMMAFAIDAGQLERRIRRQDRINA